jgi:transcriptional regulator with XRE-family HTH domain
MKPRRRRPLAGEIMSSLLREARNTRGWSSRDLRREIALAADRLGLHVASDASLRVMISRWENGQADPDISHQLLLQEAFGLDAEALGLAHPEDIQGDTTALVVSTARRTGPSDAVVQYFDKQLVEHTRFDNVGGPSFVLATAQSQLALVEQFASTGAPKLAHLAARYNEFTGWLHQDLGNDAEALRLTSRSVDLAEMSGNDELVTYNRMRKSNVLATAGDCHLAAVTAQQALACAADRYPHLVPVCLRQSALTSARLRDERGARDAIDRAIELTVAGPSSDPLTAYVTSSYVYMEAALCLLVLRQAAAAEEACTRALIGWPAELARDRTLCLARRGVALVELREIDEACRTSMLAIDGVRSAPSGRALHMLRVIVTRLRPLGRNAHVRELTDALAEVA